MTTSSTKRALEEAVERASSDYLAVSRQAHLFAPDAYEQSEETAWTRLAEAIAALSEHEAEELACTASR